MRPSVIAIAIALSVSAHAAAPSFVSVPAFGFDARPQAVAVADFDEDGNADAVAASAENGVLFVLIGDGAGGFATPVPIGDLFNPSSVAADDFDGDGHADLAVVNGGGSDAVSIFAGAGDGTFTAANSFALPFAHDLVRIADFNNDGASDLAVSAYDSTPLDEHRSIVVLLGDGAGNFASSTEIADAASFDLGDFDADGNVDLVACVGAPTGLQVFAGNGDGTFNAAARIDLSTSPDFLSVVLAADLDADGDADLATLSPGLEQQMALLPGNGDGTFGVAQTFDSRTLPTHLLGHDMDLDGIADLVIASAERDQVAILYSDGALGFASRAYYNVAFGPAHMAAADLDNDGKAELVVANNRSSNVAVLAPDGTAAQISVTPLPIAIDAADFDGDGHLDLASGGGDAISLFLGDGAGAFAAAGSVAMAPGIQGLAAGGLDEDGFADLAAVIQGASGLAFSGLAVSFGDGAGAFAAPLLLSVPGVPRHLLIADFNADGRNDLATLAAPGNVRGATVLLNSGGGAFAAPVHYPSGTGSLGHLTAADVDNDGSLDLAVAAFGPNAISILGGNGDGTFRAPYFVSLGSSQPGRFVTAADLDADGDVDLVAAGGVNVSVLPGDGHGNFNTFTSYFTGNATGVAIRDFNGDGALDLGVANGTEGTLAILSGDGSGAFADAISFPAGIEAAGIAAGDFREDGRVDAAIANQRSRTITVLRNDTGGENTPAATNVSVQPVDTTTGTTPVTVTFTQVHHAGTTTLTTSSSGPPPPSGFALGSPPTYFEIRTTASFAPDLRVCIHYGALGFPNGTSISLFHFEGGIWREIAWLPAEADGTICGQVTSLSPFAVLQRLSSCPMLTAIPSATVRIGTKNNKGAGMRVDLLAELFRNGALAGSGQIDNAGSGGPGFAHSSFHTIPMTVAAPVAVCPGDVLAFRLSVRNACADAARLWYDDAAANSRFRTTIGGSTADSFLRAGGAWSAAQGTGPKQQSDAGGTAQCSAFQPFGTWSSPY